MGKHAGNPDGTPRLELAEGNSSDDAIIAAIQAAAAEAESEAPAEAGAEEPELLSEASRSAPSDVPPILTEEAPTVEGPRPTYYDKKKQAAQAKETAGWLVMLLEGAAIMSFGEEAKLLPNEKRMISDPMARIMTRMDPALNEALQKWTDPILLLFGIGTWGMRLYAMAQDREEGDEGRGKKPPEVKPSPGGDGHGRTVTEVLAEEEAIMRAGPDARILSQVDRSLGGQQ